MQSPVLCKSHLKENYIPCTKQVNISPILFLLTLACLHQLIGKMALGIKKKKKNVLEADVKVEEEHRYMSSTDRVYCDDTLYLKLQQFYSTPSHFRRNNVVLETCLQRLKCRCFSLSFSLTVALGNRANMASVPVFHSGVGEIHQSSCLQKPV